jgi:hypothetical protein
VGGWEGERWSQPKAINRPFSMTQSNSGEEKKMLRSEKGRK